MPPEGGAIAALARRYRAQDAHPEALVRTQLAQAATASAEFTEVLHALAQRQAAASAQRLAAGRPRGPLDGIALSCKDAFDIVGSPTRLGSRVTSAAPASQDAACVARLQSAGAVLLGKTNLSEFAFSGLGLNPHQGTPVQWAASGAPHLLGGSSCGAAGALRRGLGLAALATDTSGSVRVPAAWSGLVGWRPSQARYPRAGMAALAPSLDTPGLLAHSVADVRIVDAVLHARPAAPAAPSTTFVLVDALCGTSVQPAVRDNCLRFMDRLANAGQRCARARWDAFDTIAQAFARHGTLVAAEAAHTLAAFAGAPLVEQLDPFVRERLRAARALPADSRAALLALRAQLLQAQAGEAYGTVYVFPTVPVTAPALADVQSVAQCSAANAEALRHTMPGSFLDMPGIALPSGVDEAGLPTSVLLSCRQGADDLLLAAAEQLERLQLFFRG